MHPQVNLLPVSIQRRFEHRRQARHWGITWLAVAFLLIVGQGAWDAQFRQTERQLEAARAATAAIRHAQVETQRLRSESTRHRQLVENARSVEQADVMLALLQVVSDSCREMEGAVQLESLRLDESPGGNLGTGPQAKLRRQLRLVGVADADSRVAAFVTRLRESRAFEQVELEGSQAQTEHAGSERSFQIRCQQ